MKTKKLVLKASAGTGKTYRLSLEYVIALLNEVDFKNILVMTFTRKATAEIKKEVLEKIENFIEIYKLIENSEEDVVEILIKSNLEEKKKDNYKKLIENIEKNSKIRINKEYLYKLSKVYEDIIKNKEKMKIYTIDAFLNIIFKNIVINFLKIKTFSIIDEDENDYYYKKVLENIFKDKTLFSEFKNFFVDNSEKNIDKYIETIKKLIEGRWKYLISIYGNENFYSKEKFEIKKKSSEALKDIFDYIQNDCGKDLQDSLKKDYQKFIGKTDKDLKKLMFDDFKIILSTDVYNGNKFKKKTDVEHKEYMSQLHEILRKNLSQEIYNETLLPYEKNIMALNKEIYKIYDEIKIRERKFTFNDIAVYSYATLFDVNNFLIDENGLTKSFFEMMDIMQIDTVFIDEFQDTSVLQWKILYEIIKKAKNIICVGDEKQSIYGWRGGEKRLFENLEKVIDTENVENMATSYRSDINIVDYTNDIFKKISQEKQNWKFENSVANSKEKGYVKSINIAENTELSINEILVEELKKTGFKNYSDIAIIARTNKELEEIANLLENEKIPYILNKKSDITNYSGIFEYLEILKYLLYDNELALFNFFASDIGNLGTDELEILLKNKEKTFNFLNGIEDKTFKSILSEKILSLLLKIREIKKYKKLSAQELTYKIFEIFNFSAIFTKERELKNLAEAYLISQKYENILELLNAYRNSEIKLSANIVNNNAIELMSIHKSKGLQFKTVFVLNKETKRQALALDFIFSMNENYSSVDFSLFLKKGYEKVIENVFPEIIKAYKNMQEEEEINNFYVAITRAKNNLFIISTKLENYENGELKYFEIEEIEEKKEEKTYILKNKNPIFEETEEIEISSSKFSLQTEEKRMLGILIHYFLENIKYATNEEINYAIKLCYKDYLSYFGEEKLKRIFSNDNLNKILELSGEIFSSKWNHIYSEYEVYDYENKKSYRIDRIMIKDDDGSGNGEIYIVDYKTGAKNEEQLSNYARLISENFGDEIQNYKIKTKFLEFDIEY